MIEVGPDVGQQAFKDAEDEIAKLQGTFDLHNRRRVEFIAETAAGPA